MAVNMKFHYLKRHLVLEEKGIVHKYLHLYIKMKFMEIKSRSGKKQKLKLKIPHRVYKNF